MNTHIQIHIYIYIHLPFSLSSNNAAMRLVTAGGRVRYHTPPTPSSREIGVVGDFGIDAINNRRLSSSIERPSFPPVMQNSERVCAILHTDVDDMYEPVVFVMDSAPVIAKFAPRRGGSKGCYELTGGTFGIGDNDMSVLSLEDDKQVEEPDMDGAQSRLGSRSGATDTQLR